MHVRHAGHGHERQIVQEPPKDGVQAAVVDLVDFLLLELDVTTLPAHDIPGGEQSDEQEAEGTTPVDCRVAEEEVLYNVVVPPAHSEADVEDGPLPELRSEIVLFVRVGNKRIVRRHHGDVKVEEVAEKGGLVRAWVTGGNCNGLLV